MAQAKKMNEVTFAKIGKELGAVGEFIRTKQGEKQSAMDDFEKERDRFKKGKISKSELTSSSSKVNKELMKTDKALRDAIFKVGKIAAQSREFAAKQKPKIFRASISGIKLSGVSKGVSKKKATSKKAAPKKAASKKKVKTKPTKTALAKELTLDRKFSK